MAELKPFTPRTTEAIDRANRLLGFKDSPAWNELWRISKGLVDDAAALLIDYPGWDKDQIAVLKARAQAAKEHHDLLFARILQAITEGVEDARQGLSEAQEAQLRNQVLQQTGTDSRIPGSY